MLTIVHYPDPVLRLVAEEIDNIDAELTTLISDMFDTMYAANGLGLAAPQIAISKRLIVVDISEEVGGIGPIALINPKIIWKSKNKETCEEGCLSFPEVSAKVSRPATIKVQAIDVESNIIEFEAEGLFARCIQHEIDHLDGILFPDKVTLAGKFSIKSSLKVLEEEYKANH